MERSVDWRELEELAEALADAAAAETLPRFRQGVAVSGKESTSGFDPVTEADRAAEGAMRSLIRARFPSHGIVGEEHGTEETGSRWTWVLDPIDGTRAFISGFPTWGTLIGLLRDGEPVLGVIDQPWTGERWVGTPSGTRYRCRGVDGVARCRPCAGLGEASLSATSPEIFATPEERAVWSELTAKTRIRKWGGDCYGYAMVASGHLDLVVEAGLALYDIAAVIPVIRGAGGIVTTWSGAPVRAGGCVIAAGDPAVHREALAVAQGASSSHIEAKAAE